MRTKHVLMTTALLSLFAACTNDDFVSYEQGAQSGDAAKRPTVDVTLNVLEGNGANTRLAFDADKGYQWQANDTIGALLMDKLIATTTDPAYRPHDDIEAWEEMPWVDRYALVDYINTDYPFVRQSDGTWTTNAKMLEGNYFFTFPFAAYSGNREAIHSIGEQVQDGTTDASLREAYAKNNFFVGYARIHAGTDGAEVMSADLEMTPVLGAVGIKILNTGNQDFQVKKIVLQSEVFQTLIKVDPTKAEYKGENGEKSYNLDNSKLSNWGNGTFFNYANYEEMERTGDTWTYSNLFEERYGETEGLVNNTEKSENYNRQNALRAVINGLNWTGHDVDGADDRAELTVLNAPVQRGNDPANVQRFLIMTNIYKNGTNKPINAYIYTDRGLVGPVRIDNVQGEVEQGTGGDKTVTVISDNPIVEIAPGVPNSVTLEIDDNSIQPSTGLEIYNESDLLQLIEWNQTMSRVYTANLQNDVTLTKEMSDLLVKSGVSSKMLVQTNGNKLVIADDAAANILDYVLVRNDDQNVGVATIKVENDLTLGSHSYVSGMYYPGSIYSGSITIKNELEIAEGASVTVASAITNESTGNYRDQSLVVAENEGILTINAAVEELTVAENKAEMFINANVSFVAESKNMPNAEITIAEGVSVSAGTTGTSYLTNAGRNYTTDPDAAEYAVIYNNGVITNLGNKAWGKVVAGANSTTNVNENEANAIIDISANINAEWRVNGTNNGAVSYTATQAVALADVIKSGLTELVVDGGSVTGVAKTTTNGQTDAEAKAVTKIVVKENGGTIGNAEFDANGNRLYWRSQFPNATTVETNGNATLVDVDLAGAADINVKSGTTTIKGKVTANSATVTLGSYDGNKYVAYDATLSIPTTEDRLEVLAITKTNDSHADQVTATVINQGYVQIGQGQTVTGIDSWRGEGEENFKTDPEVDKMTIDTNNGGSLADLVGVTFSDDAVITINGGLNMSLESNKNNVGLLADKNVVVDGGGFYNLTNAMGLSMNSLTVGSGNCIVSGDATQPSVVVLTVNNLNYPENTTLGINDGWIRISGNQELGAGSTGINNGGELKGNGAIIGYTSTGQRLGWDGTKWVAQN